MHVRSKALKVRKAVVVLSVTASIGLLAPTDATAGRGGWRSGGAGGWRGAAFGVIGAILTSSTYGIYGYPYDYGGYGEYAEYGPWARSVYRHNCYSVRQPVRTEDGWLFRKARICE